VLTNTLKHKYFIINLTVVCYSIFCLKLIYLICTKLQPYKQVTLQIISNRAGNGETREENTVPVQNIVKKNEKI